jgi:hypothetical protein
MNMDTERLTPGCLSIALALALFALVAACGDTPQQSARHVVTIAADALDLADIASAQAYTAHAREALDASHDLVEYHASMAPFDALEQALRTADEALHIADAAVRLWDQGGVDSWPQALACVVGALVGVQSMLQAAGLVIPPELTSALDVVHGLVSGDQCFSHDAGV